MTISLETAQNMLARAVQEYEKALAAQSHGEQSDLESFSISRQSLSELQDGIDYWERKVTQLSSNRRGPRVRRLVPNGQ